MVLGAHTSVVTGVPVTTSHVLPWIFDGTLGVRFFFVISGFLITWLMLSEHERTGRVNLRNFYIRRSIRILPVYYAFLAVLFALQELTVFRLGRLTWLGNLTFTSNFFWHDWTSGHLWSLAQEEQFYLFWPMLFILAGAHRKISAVAFILAIPVVICPLIRVALHLKLNLPLIDNWKGLFACDSIAIGCAGAIALKRKREVIGRLASSHGPSLCALGAALVIIPFLLTSLLFGGIFTVPLGATFQNVGILILLLHSVTEPGFGPYRVLGWRWVREMGVLSYSIYIWQQIFCTNPSEFGMARVWWITFPGWLLPAFGAGVASYYCLERPLLKLRGRYRSS
jgi:peptidoglycan/LPS O-acetylase OafA/YrhL